MTEAANPDIRIRQVSNMHVKINDAVLIKQYQNGDTAALEQLVLKYQNRIYNVILKICADPDDAAELTQETFVKVIENLDRFEGRSGFYTWTFRIAVNLTLNYCQRGQKIAFRSLDTQDDEHEEHAKQQLKQILSDGRSPDPADIAQNKELCEIAMRSLMKLDDNQRAVIALRDIEGMSYAQIAEILDIELGTVRSRLSRARGNLRDILESIL